MKAKPDDRQIIITVTPAGGGLNNPCHQHEGSQPGGKSNMAEKLKDGMRYYDSQTYLHS